MHSTLSDLAAAGVSLFGQGSRLLKLRFPESSGFSEESLLPHRLSAALEVLISKGFDSAELQLRWAALALSFRQTLEDIPELVAALAEAPSDGDLLARIDQLPDEVWAAQDVTP